MISQAADIRFGKTRREATYVVKVHLRRKGTLKGNTIHHGWWENYLQRNPTLRLCSKTPQLTYGWIAITAENLRAYYKSVFDEHGLDSNPEAIYNMDEASVPL